MTHYNRRRDVIIEAVGFQGALCKISPAGSVSGREGGGGGKRGRFGGWSKIKKKKKQKMT